MHLCNARSRLRLRKCARIAAGHSAQSLFATKRLSQRNEVTSTNDPTAHAQILAIRPACALLGKFNLLDCDIYTSCEPCPMCLGAIYWARLRRVYYANTRIEAAQIGSTTDSSMAKLRRRRS